MKRIRIGKDINVQWVLHAPAGVVLTSENLSLEMKGPKGRQVDLPTFTLEVLADNKYAVYVALRGTSFSQLGNYTLTAWLNKNQVGQSVVDAVNAFTLVGSTQQEDDLQSCGCGCLNFATVDMQGDISFVGQPGYSPTANVVKEGDTVTITITDKDGTTTATVKDGKDGDDGASPIANVVKSGNTATITVTDKNGTSSASISDGADGNDGVSPTVQTSKSNGVTTVTITDKNGSHTATIEDGADGYSPSATVTQTSSGATISITDKNGTTTANVSNGSQGDPGVSPAVAVETITGGHQVTITDATHPNGQSFDVMDGNDAPAVQEIFWATYGTTTATEIQTALDAGKAVMCSYGGAHYTFGLSNTTYFILYALTDAGQTVKRLSISKSTSSWGYASVTAILNTDKIGSTSSTTASDANVYSALATKNLIDAVDDKIGTAVSLTFTYEDDTTATYSLLTSNS